MYLLLQLIFQLNTKTDMQITSMQTGNALLLQPKPKDQDLRRSFSECLYNGKDRLAVPAVISGGGGSSDDATETVRCACCNVPEDCTAAYIRRVRAAHCGSWVCAASAQRPSASGCGGSPALAWRRRCGGTWLCAGTSTRPPG
ncbi:hypothetical protein PR202_ga11536 [Eleusine coracana subsp. coracana]|uniref:Uncharacterized protein n=1 Tax=Eleusine coracana subsp. coracana TaxID=191504 RepID=A0AAV5C9U2_ELECO|nr:hypothetical protein PR202_ga11536 [Eleusine coracana subsp. coracana]